jgi:hypothetical protein
VKLPESVVNQITRWSDVFSLGLGSHFVNEACLGFASHLARLRFWTVLPIAMLTLVFLATLVDHTLGSIVCVPANERKPLRGRPLLIGSIPTGLKVLFLLCMHAHVVALQHSPHRSARVALALILLRQSADCLVSACSRRQIPSSRTKPLSRFRATALATTAAG